MRSALRWMPGVALLALVLLGLEWAVEARLIRRALLPPPSVIGAALWDLLASGDFAAPLFATLWLVFAGFAIGSALGIAAGVAMGWWTGVHRLLEPLVELLRPIPKAALVPAMMLFLGIGEAMKITSVALAVFFPVLVNTLQGVRGVDRVLLDAGRTHGWGTAQILRHLVLPASLPFILAGMRVALGLALVLAVLSEMLSGQGGLGFLILDMQRSFQVRLMYAWLVILAVVGLVLVARVTLQFLSPTTDDEPSVSNSLDIIGKETSRRSTVGGSSFEPFVVAGPADYPMTIVRTLTRPLLPEATGLSTLIPALETTALLVLAAVGWRRLVSLPRLLLTTPYVVFSALIAIMGGLAFSRFGNLAILVRQRSLILPALLVLLCLPPGRARPGARDGGSVAIRPERAIAGSR